MKRSAMIIGALTLLLHGTAFAHGGKTDASGCHTEKKTGEYHCHGGSSATGKQAKATAKTTAKTGAKSVAGGTICTGDIHNCSDFRTHSEAQDVFNRCYKQTGRDVHGLDRDDDGEACESLS